MINFSRHARLYALISLIVIGIGIYHIVQYGYRVSIDFTGGTQITYATAPSPKLTRQVVETMATGYGAKLVDYSTTASEVSLRLTQFDDAREPDLRKAIQTMTQAPISLSSLESVGPTVGADAIRKTIYATLIGVLIILSYIMYAFKRWTFALAAIVALMHDVLVVLGGYAIVSHYLGAQLDTLFVTALLTTMSFSTHDTIVIFDNIRDALKKGSAQRDIAQLSDIAVSATMVRSLNNSLTIIFMLLALVLLGGMSIRYFAVALLIGTVTGVYSSPFVATPVMVWLESRRRGSTVA